MIALVIGAVVIGVGLFALGNPLGTPAPSPTATAGAVAPTPAQSHGDGTCPTSAPPPMAAGETRDVTIETAKGNIVIRLDGSTAPNATGNFAALVECHFYDGIVFHRLVPDFVIQGGDPEGTGRGGPGYEIKDDPKAGEYKRGTVAMARTPAPDSQGSQFFIVLADDAAGALNSAEFPYAILGEVISGMDVVDMIAAMPNSGPPSNTALEPLPMIKVTISEPVSPSTPPASPGSSAAGSPEASPGGSPAATP